MVLYFSWLISIVATAGSLFFSEIMHFPPCILCWYQRIAMYPLVLLLAVGIFKNDRQVLWYAGPLAFIGWIIAVYHNLLYYHVLPESIAPCQQGISCTSVQVNWFGFISIPLMSLTAFTLLLVTFIFHKKLEKNG